MTIITLFEGKFKKLVSSSGWEYLERKGHNQTNLGVIIIAIDEINQKLILVEQWRESVKSQVLELPAGVIEINNKNVLNEALRELEEETGYKSDNLILIAENGVMSPGMVNEREFIVLALNCFKKSSGGGVKSENENTIVHEIDLNHKKINDFIQNKISEGIIIDLKIYTGLFFLLEQKKLFL